MENDTAVDASSDTLTAGQGDEAPDTSTFLNAMEFVDAEIDAAEAISDLSVEAFVTLAVLRIVKHPHKVRVNIAKTQRLVVIEFAVAEDDIGQVIGKEGHTIIGIRNLAKSAAGETDVEYWIHLLERRKPAPERRRRTRFQGGNRYGSNGSSRYGDR